MLRGFKMDNSEGLQAEVKCQFAFMNRHAKSIPYPKPHSHSCTEIIYNGEGSGWMHEDERKLRYLPNQVIVYKPGPMHWSEDEPESLCYHVCIGVSGELSEGVKAGVFNSDLNLTLLFKLVEVALTTQSKSSFQRERLDMLSALVCLSLQELAAEDNQKTTPSSSIHAQRAKALIDARFMEPLTLDDLASNVYVSGDHLRSIFKREYGMAPIHYLLNKRIELAQGYLRESDRKIVEIAKLCGFSDPYYFSRIFKKMTGKSPQDYRATNGAKGQ